MNKKLLLVLCSAVLPLSGATHFGPKAAREFLTFDELVTLSNTDEPPPPAEEKLNRLLTTPFLSNDAALAGARPHRPSVDGIGPVLRVASWNIERGLNFDLIRLALSDPRRVQAGCSGARRRWMRASSRRSISNCGRCAMPI